MQPIKNHRGDSFPDALKTDQALTREARERGVSKSDLTREAVRRMLAR